MVITWARGGQLFSGGRGYRVRCPSPPALMSTMRSTTHPSSTTHLDAAQCIFEFPLACGITVGTPVRVRTLSSGQLCTYRQCSIALFALKKGGSWREFPA